MQLVLLLVLYCPSAVFANAWMSVYGRMKGDTPVNSTMSVGQARKLVEQLKIEASFCRIKVRDRDCF